MNESRRRRERKKENNFNIPSGRIPLRGFAFGDKEERKEERPERNQVLSINYIRRRGVGMSRPSALNRLPLNE
jgi:hypothetical protein